LKKSVGGGGKLALAAAVGKKGDYPRAVRILGELISESEAPPEAWLLLGRSFHALKNYSRALAAYNDYLKLRPRSSQGRFFAGRTYLTLGMPYRAVPLLKKALELEPRNVFTMAFLGMAYLRSKHSGLAVDMFQQAVETAAETGLPEEQARRLYRAYLNALLVRGARLCRAEEYPLGIQMLRFVLDNGQSGKESIDSPFLRLELGRACREMGRLEEALEHYSRALEFSPGDRRIRWYRASILMSLGKNDEARGEIEYIRSRDRGVPNLPWNSRLVDLFMIRSFLETREWRRAAEGCRAALKGGIRDPLIHALYAEALRNLKDFPAAHNHLLRAVEEEPGELQFRYADILVSWEGGDWKNLRRALRAAASLGGDPDLIRRFEVLLEARSAGDDRKSLALLQGALRALGPEPELMYALGEAYLKLGLAEEALGWFRKTRSLQGDHERSWLGEIAALEVLQGEGISVEEALKGLYREYLDHWPDNFSIRRERALFLVRICEYAEAAEELERLLAWEPANSSLRRVLAYSYRKTGRYREAAVFLKALLREKPKNVELLIEFSGCLERAGAANYAMAVLEKSLEHIKKSGDILLALGLLWYRRRNIERAFDMLREAAARNPRDPRPYEWMALIAGKNGETGKAARYDFEAQKRKKLF
jgi:tetratricopeptide (TPR) repeat protein